MTISFIPPLDDSTLQHDVGGGDSTANEQSVGEGKVSSSEGKDVCAWAPKVKCSNMLDISRCRSRDRRIDHRVQMGREDKLFGEGWDYESIRTPGRNAVAESGAERDNTSRVEESSSVGLWRLWLLQTRVCAWWIERWLVGWLVGK